MPTFVSAADPPGLAAGNTRTTVTWAAAPHRHAALARRATLAPAAVRCVAIFSPPGRARARDHRCELGRLYNVRGTARRRRTTASRHLLAINLASEGNL